jgi:hypothetical protein
LANYSLASGPSSGTRRGRMRLLSIAPSPAKQPLPGRHSRRRTTCAATPRQPCAAGCGPYKPASSATARRFGGISLSGPTRHPVRSSRLLQHLSRLEKPIISARRRSDASTVADFNSPQKIEDVV